MEGREERRKGLECGRKERREDRVGIWKVEKKGEMVKNVEERRGGKIG
jgi:hypothetical protein